MRSLLLPLVVLTLGCPSGPSAKSVSDDRLGTMVLELDGRDAHLDGPSPVRFSVLSPGYTPDGSFHLIAATRTTRRFGSADWEESKSYYRVITPAGEVRELPPPELAYPTIGTASLLFTNDTHQPVLFFSGALPGGRLLTTFAFDGSAWKRADFLRKDRPTSDLALTFGGGAGQLRAPSADELLVQHSSHLLRGRGSEWTELPLPAGAKTFRLGRFGKDGLRAWWTDKAGQLFTDLLEADGTWRGPPVGLGVPGVSFGKYWGHSGTGDVYTLHVDLEGGQVLVLRYAEGLGFRVLERRDPTAAEVAAQGSTLLSYEHPYRGWVQDGSDQLTATYLGVPTGPLGKIDRAEAKVDCPASNQCAVDGGWAYQGPDCLKCVPRRLNLVNPYAHLPDLSGVGVMQLDNFDAVTRVYVKKVALPAVEGFSWKPFVASPFPGDDGSVDDEVMVTGSQLRLKARFLFPGLENHEGITAALQPTGSVDAGVQTLTTAPNGALLFAGVPKGEWRLEVSAPGYLPWSRGFTGADVGLVDVGDQVLVSALVQDAGFDPTLSSDYSAFNQGLVQWGGGRVQVMRGGVMTTLTQALAPGTRPLNHSAGLAWNEGTCPGAGCTLATDPPNPNIPDLPAADVRGLGTSWAWPDGPVDGVTPRQWVAQYGSSVAPWVTAFDVESSSVCGGYSWDVAADGGVQPMVLRDCSPYGLRIAVYSTEPLPVLKARRYQPGIGFDAADCGLDGQWRTGCKLFFMFDAMGKKLSDSGLFGWSAAPEGFALFLEQASPSAPVVLARYGLQSDTRVDLATGLTLPTWLPGERPLYGPYNPLLRVDDGLYRYPVNGTARQLILDHVVSARPITTDAYGEWLVVHHRDTPGTSCADGQCKVSKVEPALGTVTELVDGGANGKEAVFAGGVLMEQTWAGCPGGPCPVVWLIRPLTPTVPLTLGTVWPDRTQSTWVPYEIGPYFLRAAGGAQVPSGL